MTDFFTGALTASGQEAHRASPLRSEHGLPLMRAISHGRAPILGAFAGILPAKSTVWLEAKPSPLEAGAPGINSSTRRKELPCFPQRSSNAKRRLHPPRRRLVEPQLSDCAFARLPPAAPLSSG